MKNYQILKNRSTVDPNEQNSFEHLNLIHLELEEIVRKSYEDYKNSEDTFHSERKSGKVYPIL